MEGSEHAMITIKDEMLYNDWWHLKKIRHSCVCICDLQHFFPDAQYLFLLISLC